MAARTRRADPHRRQRQQAAHPRRAAGEHHRPDRRGADPGPDSDPLADRIAFVRNAAGERFDELELNISVIAMPTDDSGVPDLSLVRRFLPDLTEDEMLATPAVLSGSPRDIADTIRGYRDDYGVTYITVQQQHGEAFAKVIAELR